MDTFHEKNGNRDQLNIKSKDAALSIKSRLYIGFSIVVLTFIVAIGISLFLVDNAKQLSAQVIEVDFPRYDIMRDFGNNLQQLQLDAQSLIITGNNTYKEKIDATWVILNRLYDNIKNGIQSNDTRTLQSWDHISSLLLKLKADQEIALNLSSKTPTITDLQKSIELINTSINNILVIIDGPLTQSGIREGGLFDEQYKNVSKGNTLIIAQMSKIELTEYIISVIGILVSLIIAAATIKNILRHINVFREFSNKIASRDLRSQLTIESNDEIGQLGNDLNIMTDSLSSITKQITLACQNMMTTLEEVRQAVNVQSSGANEQASSINQITASLEEIEKSSSQTMDKAKMLGDAAERTREKGQQGLDAIEQSIHGMNIVREKVQLIAQTILDLSNKTQQVGEITSVVNTLAQQSKMLALNASIEAAKAGEAGKGFAVVASEVKNLAEQSEQSTAQVQKILEDIRQAAEKAVMVTEEGTKGVDNGTTLVEQTGEVVKNLSDVIRETTVASQQIEAAVRQESIGIEQITAGMNEINQVTSSFVASAKQTTEAINNLAVIAKHLKEHVDTYKV